MPIHSSRHFRCTSRRRRRSSRAASPRSDVVRHDTLMAGKGREPPRPTSAAPAAHEAGSRTRRFAGPSTTTNVDVTAGRAQRGIVACQTGRHESRHDVSNPRSSGQRLDVPRARPTYSFQSDSTVAITWGDLDSGGDPTANVDPPSRGRSPAPRRRPGSRVGLSPRRFRQGFAARPRTNSRNEAERHPNYAGDGRPSLTWIGPRGFAGNGLARYLWAQYARGNGWPASALRPTEEQGLSCGRDGFDGRGRRGYCRPRRL
jgi:hypothetical protein